MIAVSLPYASSERSAPPHTELYTWRYPCNPPSRVRDSAARLGYSHAAHSRGSIGMPKGVHTNATGDQGYRRRVQYCSMACFCALLSAGDAKGGRTFEGANGDRVWVAGEEPREVDLQRLLWARILKVSHLASTRHREGLSGYVLLDVTRRAGCFVLVRGIVFGRASALSVGINIFVTHRQAPGLTKSLNRLAISKLSS